MKNVNIEDFIKNHYKPTDFSHLHWSGNFQDYINIVSENPKVTRNAFQRMYDMIMSHETEHYKEFKKDVVRYKFFDDPFDNGKDAVFGIDVHLMKLINFFKSAAQGFGTEKRVLLLHGPVGSAKSSIARLLKKGIEHYSKTDEGPTTLTSGFPKRKRRFLAVEKFFQARCTMNP